MVVNPKNSLYICALFRRRMRVRKCKRLSAKELNQFIVKLFNE